MVFRLIGAVLFGVVGFFFGTDTVITGGVFGTISGAISSVGVFVVLGILIGLSAGPDIKCLYGQFKK